jgi:hypothetical protein
MGFYIENKNRSVSYFYHGRAVEAGNIKDNIVSAVIGRIIR